MKKAFSETLQRQLTNKMANFKELKLKRKVENDEPEPEPENEHFQSLKRKRFLWSNELHKEFLLSIFKLGLEKAKPKLLLHEMSPVPFGFKPTQIKKNLSKYRNSKAEIEALFLHNVDAAMNDAMGFVPTKKTNPAFHVYPFTTKTKNQPEMKVQQLLNAKSPKQQEK